MITALRYICQICVFIVLVRGSDSFLPGDQRGFTVVSFLTFAPICAALFFGFNQGKR